MKEKRNLVFTSAGHNSNVRQWISGDVNFDLAVYDYTNQGNGLKSYSNFYFLKKGGKFPNLKHFYNNFYSILNKYDAFFVMDDDLFISCEEINKLFNYLFERNLSILQPSFNIEGKVSHKVTRERLFSKLRYVNFIEVTCPMFTKESLLKFLQVYDDQLVGWGVDWWYLNILQDKIDQKKVAIIDEITCLNPLDSAKGGQREIDLLQSTENRKKVWFSIRENHLLLEWKPKTLGRAYSAVNFSFLLRAMIYIKRYLTYKGIKLARKR